jgi:cytochrome c oxidase cbb3-type subunit III
MEIPTMSDRDVIKSHSYDGIQEYDNDLPRWWLALLLLSVAWAFFYSFHYHVQGYPLGPAKLASELSALNEERARNTKGPLPEEVLRELSHNLDRVNKGKALFAANQCATCHGPEGTGLVGPNLRDAWWIYGSDMATIVETITNGRANGAMPPQGRNLSQDEITNLACFIASQSRSPAAGKPHDSAREKQAPIGY